MAGGLRRSGQEPLLRGAFWVFGLLVWGLGLRAFGCLGVRA